MKKFKFKIQGNQYETEILNVEGKEIELEVNGTKFHVELEEEIQTSKTPKLVRSSVPQPKTKEKKIPKKLSSTVSIKAPLPGVILQVLVKEGDIVKPGDTLIILEAMKMENKIETDKGGTVKTVKVKEGDNVLQEQVLIELM